MTKLFVKICGITRMQDADLASALGAAAVGFVFWPDSPRYIDPEAARRISERVPAPVIKVGVFVDEPLEHVARMVAEVGLDAAQLHGQETPEYCRELMARLKPESTVRLKPDTTDCDSTDDRQSVDNRQYVVSGFSRTVDSRTIIKAVGMNDNGAANIADFDADVMLLVDAHDPSRHGGTGRTVNWDVAREIAGTRATILAGGLNAANIRLAVRSVRPYGIDVSSGVESAPGVKDPARLRALFEALHD